MKSLNQQITEHIKASQKESSRCMSGFCAALPYAADEIRMALNEMVERGSLVRYGNGKSHCWKIADSK